MDYKDVQRIKNNVPELNVVSPMLFGNSSLAYYEDRKASISVVGVEPSYAAIQNPLMRYGRYINDMDLKNNRKVCVIQKKV